MQYERNTERSRLSEDVKDGFHSVFTLILTQVSSLQFTFIFTYIKDPRHAGRNYFCVIICRYSFGTRFVADDFSLCLLRQISKKELNKHSQQKLVRFDET